MNFQWPPFPRKHDTKSQIENSDQKFGAKIRSKIRVENSKKSGTFGSAPFLTYGFLFPAGAERQRRQHLPPSTGGVYSPLSLSVKTPRKISTSATCCKVGKLPMIEMVGGLIN